MAVSGEATVKTASLFKNGYAMVVREVPVVGGEAIVTEIPQSALGTFWITSTGNIKIKEVVTSQQEKSSQTPPASYDQFLSLNVGKQVTLQMTSWGSAPTTLAGKLLAVQGDTVMLKTDKGTVMINRSDIRMITFGDDATTQVTTKYAERVMRFKTEGSGTILLYGLERGMTWSPAYSLDITDPKELTLSAKSTVLNDLADLKNVDLRFVTGFPNVPWATLGEPLLSGQSVDQFTSFLNSVGISGGLGAFGGQGGGRRDAMTQNAAPAADFGAAFEPNTAPGMQAEDLFFYQQPNVSMKKGDRAFYMLFQAKSTYEHLYTTDLVDSVVNNVEYRPTTDGPTDVWHSLKLKNTSGHPLTTAAATVFKDGQIMGQDTLMYTSTGAEFLVKMSKALDVRVDAIEEETTRERQSLKLPGGAVYDLVNVKGTVSIRNMKGEAVQMRVTKDLTGEIIKVDGTPKVTKPAKGLRDVNPSSRLVWMPKIEAGKSLELTYQYKLYVRAF